MLKNWLATGENKEIEFKRDYSSPEKILESVVAFANTAGGRILIGINDDGSVAGVSSAQIPDLIDRIQNKIQDQVTPQLIPEIVIYEYEGKQVLGIQIYPSSIRPHFIAKSGKESGTYIRVGKSNRKADAERILDLERQRHNLSFDEDVCRNWPVTPDNLHHLRQILTLRLGRQISDRDLSILKLLIKQGEDHYFTHAAAIITGHLPHVITRCALFKGSNMNQFLDQKSFDGDLFTQLDSTLQFLQRHLNLAETGSINAVRQDQLEIPLDALREVIVNAYLHRDYSISGADIKVAIYDDCVEITSPGALPNGVTIEEIMRGASEIRNRILARVLLEAKLVETWGRGIVRMLELCRQAGLPQPLVRENGLFVQTTIYRQTTGNRRIQPVPVPPEPVSVAGKLKSAAVTERQIPEMIAIIDHLQANPDVTRGQLSQLTGISDSGIKRRLAKLIQMGLIARIGPDKGGTWSVIR